MAPSNPEKRYIPTVSSPLNPDSRYETSLRRTRAPRSLPPARKRPTSLSHAQSILRQKAAEVWKSTHLRTVTREDLDTADSPLRREALDTNCDSKDIVAVKGECSLGLDPVFQAMDENPSFSLLQPFTVDMTGVTRGIKHQADPPTRTRPFYLGITRRLLVIVGLLCLSFCLSRALRHRAALRQPIVVRPNS